MNIKKRLLKLLKIAKKYLPHIDEIIYNNYFKSIIFRKKHIKKNNFEWLDEFTLKLINKEEGLLEYKNLKFILPKNNLSTIPLSQKYLYAALISYFGIPKHYLFFWDDLLVFKEFFVDDMYDKIFNPQKEDIFLDIGASLGWYTCKVAKFRCNSCKYISIEPNPNYIYYLKRNLKLNKIKNHQVLKIGVWSSKSKKKFYMQNYSSGIDKTKYPKIMAEMTEIETNTIDNIISDLKLDNVNFIKMDIEGAEYEALKGAIKILKSSKRIYLIIAAYHKNQNGIETYRNIIPFLKKFGFKIHDKFLPFIYAEKVG